MYKIQADLSPYLVHFLVFSSLVFMEVLPLFTPLGHYSGLYTVQLPNHYLMHT